MDQLCQTSKRSNPILKFSNHRISSIEFNRNSSLIDDDQSIINHHRHSFGSDILPNNDNFPAAAAATAVADPSSPSPPPPALPPRLYKTNSFSKLDQLKILTNSNDKAVDDLHDKPSSFNLIVCSPFKTNHQSTLDDRNLKIHSSSSTMIKQISLTKPAHSVDSNSKLPKSLKIVNLSTNLNHHKLSSTIVSFYYFLKKKIQF